MSVSSRALRHGCSPGVHLQWREPGAGITPILYPGKRRLYTGGCWSEGLNSGLRDSGIQVGKQAPEACEPPHSRSGSQFPHLRSRCGVGVVAAPAHLWALTGSAGNFLSLSPASSSHPQSQGVQAGEKVSASPLLWEPATFGV